jgi:hypothetical protein
MTSEDTRFDRRSFLAAGAGAAAMLAMGGRLPLAGAATAARDPAIIGSYGGFVVPATGCWFGADDTTRGFTKANGIETELGRRMAIRNRRYGWLATCPSPQATADAALTNPRVVVMCSFGQPSTFPCKTAGGQGNEDLSTTSFGKGIDRITNGEFDSYWRGVATRLNAIGGPVIVRLWQEPNGQHNPYWAARPSIRAATASSSSAPSGGAPWVPGSPTTPAMTWSTSWPATSTAIRSPTRR